MRTILIGGPHNGRIHDYLGFMPWHLKLLNKNMTLSTYIGRKLGKFERRGEAPDIIGTRTVYRVLVHNRMPKYIMSRNASDFIKLAENADCSCDKNESRDIMENYQ